MLELNRVEREVFLLVAYEQGPEGERNEVCRYLDEGILGRKNSKCKGPGVGACLANLELQAQGRTGVQ